MTYSCVGVSKVSNIKHAFGLLKIIEKCATGIFSLVNEVLIYERKSVFKRAYSRNKFALCLLVW